MAFDPYTPRDAGGRFISRSAAASMLEDVGVYAADLEGWVAGSEALRWALHAKAEEVKEYWQSIAPHRGDKDPHGQWGETHDGSHPVGSPDDYFNSIEVEEHGISFKVGTHLMPLAEWLEYGSTHNPEHGYGARALAHFGGGPVDKADRLTSTLFVG